MHGWRNLASGGLSAPLVSPLDHNNTIRWWPFHLTALGHRLGRPVFGISQVPLLWSYLASLHPCFCTSTTCYSTLLLRVPWESGSVGEQVNFRWGTAFNQIHLLLMLHGRIPLMYILACIFCKCKLYSSHVYIEAKRFSLLVACSNRLCSWTYIGTGWGVDCT